jgi:hypothetical protein
MHTERCGEAESVLAQYFFHMISSRCRSSDDLKYETSRG